MDSAHSASSDNGVYSTRRISFRKCSVGVPWVGRRKNTLHTVYSSASCLRSTLRNSRAQATTASDMIWCPQCHYEMTAETVDQPILEGERAPRSYTTQPLQPLYFRALLPCSNTALQSCNIKHPGAPQANQLVLSQKPGIRSHSTPRWAEHVDTTVHTVYSEAFINNATLFGPFDRQLRSCPGGGGELVGVISTPYILCTPR